MTDLRRIARSEGRFTVRELDWDNTYYAADLDGAPYAYLQVQAVPGYDFAMLHITLLRFGRRVLQECLADHAVLNDILRAQGIRRMVHLKDAPFGKWEKLMRVLGFPSPQDTTIEGKRYRTIIMEVY